MTADPVCIQRLIRERCLSDCSAARGRVAFQQRTFQQRSPQVSGGLEGAGGSGRSFVRCIDSAMTPSLSLTIDPSPKTPYTMPMPQRGIRAEVSMWPVLQQNNGKLSIGRHTSLYKTGIVWATYRRGHCDETRSPFWLLGSDECGEVGEVYKLGAGNVRKPLLVGGSVC